MPLDGDVIVIGAGPTGSIVANRLFSKGYQVTLLDAGSYPEPGEIPSEVDRRVWPFKVVGESFDWYRMYAVGGRTHLWGSWCYPFPDYVLKRARWPFGRDTLDDAYRTVQGLLNLREGKLNPRFHELSRKLDLTIHPKVGARMEDDQIWTPLALSTTQKAKSYLPALRFLHEGDHAVSLTCFDMWHEKEVTLRAKSYILAASPIETARILLCSDLGPAAEPIGKGFVDHMVASYVLLEPAPPPFCKDPLAISGLVENFVNINEESQRPYPGGFTIELTGPLSLESMDLERMVPRSEEDSWRGTQIHAIGECFPHSKRFVTLEHSEVDVTGRPIPCIHMAWSEEEELMAKDMREACTQLADALAIPGSKLIKFTDPLTPGAGHEAGTCVMGKDKSTPCTPTGQLRSMKNVWVADASTMPTSGDRHPTFTILAQAIRVADDCERWICQHQP